MTIIEYFSGLMQKAISGDPEALEKMFSFLGFSIIGMMTAIFTCAYKIISLIKKNNKLKDSFFALQKRITENDEYIKYLEMEKTKSEIKIRNDDAYLPSSIHESHLLFHSIKNQLESMGKVYLNYSTTIEAIKGYDVDFGAKDFLKSSALVVCREKLSPHKYYNCARKFILDDFVERYIYWMYFRKNTTELHSRWKKPVEESIIADYREIGIIQSIADLESHEKTNFDIAVSLKLLIALLGKDFLSSNTFYSIRNEVFEEIRESICFNDKNPIGLSII